MSDSLRDQLIAAGYKAPKQEKKKQSQHKKKSKKRPAGKPASSAGKSRPPQKEKKNKQPGVPDEAAIAERKKLKAEIKALIDEHKVAEWKGEIAYRYLVDSRIRELYVTSEIQERLASRELAITRLNGDTYLVPRETALSIKKINPQWSVFNLEEQPSASSEEAEEYSAYKVPDDLKW